jgi:hypothetical protein
MREPLRVISQWMLTADNLRSPPPLVQAAYKQVGREDEGEAQHWIDWSDDELTQLLQVVDQQRLEFSEEDAHANVRLAVARYLETTVIPSVADPAIWKLPERLRNARKEGTLMYHPAQQKFVTIWDEKAGLPLLCPDDAREEAMRLQRRYVPILADWRNSGKAVHQGVFTTPNVAPGKLRAEMRRICKRLVDVLWKSGKFPQIKGMMVTLEAPLSRHRDWNVHLNVLLMCDGYLDYGDVRRAWHWDVELQRVRVDPKKDESYADAIKRSMRELVKYPVRAMPEKSHAKAAAARADASGRDHGAHDADGREETGRLEVPGGTGGDRSDEATARARSDDRAAAPALIDWTAAEWIEWWEAHQKFRRTRTYGELYGIAKPEPESLDGFVAVGFVRREGTQLIRRLTLLDSIPGDKSSETSLVDRYRRALQSLRGPPDEARRALQLTSEAMQAWQQHPDLTH